MWLYLPREGAIFFFFFFLTLSEGSMACLVNHPVGPLSAFLSDLTFYNLDLLKKDNLKAGTKSKISVA